MFSHAVDEIKKIVKPSRRRPYLQIKVENSVDTIGLYDTGADVTCVREEVVKAIPVNLRPALVPVGPEESFFSAGCSPLNVLGRVKLNAVMNGKPVTHSFVCVKQLNEPVLLGMDFLKRYGLNYDVDTEQYRWRGDSEWSKGHLQIQSVTNLEALTVHELKVKVKSEGGSTPGHSDLCLVNVVSTKYPLLSGGPYLVQPDQNGYVTVPIQNCAPTDLVLDRNDVIGVIENVTQCQMREINPRFLNAVTMQTASQDKLSDAKKDFIFKALNLNVPEQFRDAYVKVILKHHSCISQHKFDLGRTQTLLHEIALKTDEPIYVKQFRIPDAHREEVERHVAEWLKMGVVQTTRSRYNSPIFAVAKKNGGIRLVQDFRALNAQSHLDKYSMKDVSECIGDIGRSGSTIFSTLDLTGGFWQLVLQPKSRPYTAFTLPGRGQFQWVTTPQGLLGAPATFQRLMETVVHGLDNVIVYIDDLLIHSASHEDHLRQLDQVLERLVQHNVKINLAKCEFGSKNVAYLGFRLTEEGVKPGADKLKAVEQAPPPSNVHEVRQFLGLCNFFRTHVRNFAQITAPLTSLTRKDSSWKGGVLPPAALKAFKELQSYLCSEPVMAYPRRDRQYALITDASLGVDGQPGGLGAILTQIDQKGEHHAVAYASRRLQKHEANYTPFLLEMQAAVWGMEHYDTHLRGRPFLLFTDHRPLEKLGKVHTKTLNRLQEAMGKFNFEILYKKGSEMPADYLSRNVVAAINWESKELVQAQNEDNLIKALKNFLLNKELPNDANCQRLVRHFADSCFVENDIVWKRVKRKFEPSRVVIFLPETLVENVLSEAHGHLLGGHDGVFKTKERLFQCYYWPGMDTDIAQHLQHCHRCQIRKKDGKPEPVLVSSLPQPTEPNQRIHADLFGPLRSSGHQKKFVLCITDAFSKYVELVALPNKEAPTVAQGIFEKWFCRFGIPLEIVTDQGSEFCASLTQDLFKLMQVSHLRTTAYHPQCNSQAEVANKTIAKYLSSFVDDSTLDWEPYLAPLMLVYNTSFHRSIKTSPFFLTFGIEARLPNLPTPDIRRKFYGESSSDELLLRLLAARDVARRNNELTTEQTTLNANKKTMPHNFSEGQLVLLDERSFLHKNAKLAPKWSGPHKVVKLKGDNNVELKLKSGRHLLTHASRLKTYFVPLNGSKTALFSEPKPDMFTQQDSDLAPLAEQADDPFIPPPPPLHRFHLRGLPDPEAAVAPSRIPSLAPPAPPSRTPSLAPPTRYPSLAPPTRTSSLAPQTGSTLPEITISDAGFASSALDIPPTPKRGRGRPRKNPVRLPPVAEAHPPATPPADKGGVQQSADPGVQIDIVKDDEGEWVTVVRRKQRRKNKWNKLQMENFKRFGDPY